MTAERRAGPPEVRAEGRRLVGPAIRYGDVSPSHRERFEPGAFRLDDTTRWLDYRHDREKALAWTGGGGLTLTNSRTALEVRAELPAIPLADRALEEVRAGKLAGFSIEFHARAERRESGVRVVERAELIGVGLVGSPSYQQSKVEIRGRSGRTIISRIPAGRKMACTCSGVTCKFAEITGDAMAEMFDEAFEQAAREVVAGFGSYTNMPLASVSSGTLRGKTLKNGDGEIEIDIPTGAAGDATIAAHEAAGVIVRPHIDADLAAGQVVGETMVYDRAPVRAFVVSATDQREGWPAPVIVATPDGLEVAQADAPRLAAWL